VRTPPPPVTDAAFATLAAALCDLRSFGATTVLRRPVGSDGPGATRAALLAERGWNELGGAWMDVDAERAARIVAWLLEHDLAYETSNHEAEAAAQLAAKLVGACGAGRWCTNGPLVLAHLGVPGMASGWRPLTGATFDSGVIFEGDHEVLIFWVEDED
jgi:hypothetical protein